jgi:hypothetical protein
MNYDLVGTDLPPDGSPSRLLIEAGRKIGVLSITQALPHSLLMALALKHAVYQADVRKQGHQGFDQRAADVMRQWPGAEVSEIANESWPKAGVESAAAEAYDSWRQSAGHWKACNSPHTYFGYGMALGSNGTWYSCGLFANCDGASPQPTPAPDNTEPCGILRRIFRGRRNAM